MSAEPTSLRRLAPVDLDSGELVDPEIGRLHQRISDLEQLLKDAEVDLRSKRAQITRLKRDKAEERTKYSRRDDVARVHRYWNRRLGHRQGLTADRFDAIKDRLEETELRIVDGKAEKVPIWQWPEDFQKAIDGAWFDPFITVMKNGRKRFHDDLALIFKDGKTMQSFIDRAP